MRGTTHSRTHQTPEKEKKVHDQNIVKKKNEEKTRKLSNYLQQLVNFVKSE